MNYKNWLIYATNKLINSSTPKLDAEILLRYVTKKTKIFFIVFSETELTLKQEKYLNYLLNCRIKGEPIAYLIKEKEFWSLPIKVSNVALIPRIDTECLVERALELLSCNQKIKILDLGTGTGVIGLALASELPKANIVSVDISKSVIDLAVSNAINLSINNIKFYKSNWFSSLPVQKFDMIISNPPYIDKNDLYLKKGDVRFEPKIALVSSNNGLADIELIIKNSRKYLVNNGWILLEHGWLQGEKVRKLYFYYHYFKIETFQDYSGNNRITRGQWKFNEKCS